ncbi:MAG TPA: translocation/assembly module TamB domain-containing protein, partial [Thermoanaerobaculia bacterium]|nr:translocation/assembly module TamB domain-containing protein [Thermoanaerobaculia bacterium]
EAMITLPDGRPYPLAVSARARFGPRRIDLERVLVAGQDLQARASGRLLVPEEDRHLELDLSAFARVALASHLGYLDPDERPAEGPVRFEGDLLWRPAGWSIQGRLTSSRLLVAERVLTDVDGVLRVRPEALRYEVSNARYAGGGIAGLIAADLQADPRSFEVDLALQDLSLRTLVEDQGLPLEGVSGRVGGQVSYRFAADEPQEGSGWADLQLTSAQPAPLGQGLALTGQVPLEIDRGTLRTEALRLVSASGSQVVRAEGFHDLSSGVGEFRWDLATSDVGQLASLVPAEAEPGAGPPPWLPTAGRGEAEGVLRLEPAGFRVDTTFDLAQVAAPGLLADRLEGSASVSAEGLLALRLQAVRAGGALLVVGSVPFEEGVRGVPFELNVDAASWPADERLAAWLPFDLPVAGAVSGQLELGGSPEALTGRADLAVEPAEVAGFEVDRLDARLAFDPERLRVERVVAAAPAGVVTAAGTLLLESGAMDFRVEAPALDLREEPFAAVLAGDVEGTLSLAADLEGTLERPRARATLSSEGLTVAGRELVTADREALLEVSWDGREVAARGGLAGLLGIEGGGLLTTEEADLRFAVSSASLGEIAELVAPRVPEGFAGEIAGELRLAGELASPEDFLVRLELPAVTLRFEDHALRNVEPVVVRYTGDSLAIDSLYLEEPGTGSELFAQGTLGIGEEMPLDLRILGSVSTDWVEVFVPTVRMEGSFDVLATVGGTVTEPRMNGQGELRNGRLIMDGLPQELDKLTAVVLFYPEQIVLDHLSAEMGAGGVRASGRVGLYGPQGLDYRLQASLQNVTFRYPEGFWLRADAALSLLSTPDGRLLRGTVTFDRAYYVKDLEIGILQLLRRALRAERLEVAETGELEASTQLAVSVEAPAGTVRVRNNLADLRGQADLTLRGTLASPVVFGTVEMERGGTLVYAENEFEVERARLTFASPARIDPILDLTATTEVREYLVTLDLTGKLETLQARVASDPPLSDLDIVSLLTTGQPPGSRGVLAGAGGIDAYTAERFLAGQAASVVSERVGTLFGFDKFRIAPVGREAGGAIGGVGVTVGKRISKDVFVTYTEQPAAPEGSILQVEWQIDQNLTLVFTGTGDDTYRVDARWDKRF